MMKIGCCTTIDRYDELVEIGYDAITLAGKDIVAMSDEEFEAAVEKMAAGPLVTSGVNTFCPPTVQFNGEAYDLAGVREYTEKLCERAKKLGIVALGVGAPNSRRIENGYPMDKGMAEFEESLKTICAVAAEHDMEVMLEALATVECNCITTTTEALALVKKLGIDNLHLVYDIYHAFMMDESPEVIREAIDEIRTVHISGYGDGKRPYLTMPEAEPLLPYIAVLKELGYDGEISVEAFYGDIHAGFVSTYEILKAAI